MNAVPQVLFTHSYLLKLDPVQHKIGLPYPPLGTLYAAAVARQKLFDVRVFDTLFCRHADEIAVPLADRPDYVVIYDDGFNYLTKMCLSNMRAAAFDMIALAKTAGATVVVCSSDSSDRYIEYLEAGADFIAIGEGEATVAELLEAHSSRSDIHAISGIAFRENGCITRTTPRGVLRDLDSLPLPAWDLLDISPYRATWLRNAGYFSLNVGTTRGCPFKCNWCAKPIYGNRYHSRSAEHVVNELLFLKQRFNVDHIWFCDDIFGLKPGWVQRFAELVKQNDLHIRFKIQSRADLLLEPDTVRSLATAGCETVWMGAESGSQKILDAMDKGITVAQIAAATRLLKAYGVRPAFFIQFGYPGETRDDIRLTTQMIYDLLPPEIGISVSYPLPGTVFYERVKSQLTHKTSWTDSNELAMLFDNPFPTRYYKQLYRYVHYNHRARVAWSAIRRSMNLSSHIWRVPLRLAKLLFCLQAAFVYGIRLRKLEASL